MPVTGIFMAAVQTFNQGNYQQLRPVLHPEVIVNKVDDPNAAPISGIDNVINYLVGQQGNRRPQFQAPNPIQSPPNLPNNATHCLISGIGTYRDISVGQVTQPFDVRYFFSFRYEGGAWLLVNASAVPV